MKGLTSAVLILGIIAPTALAQSPQVLMGRHRILASWVAIVRGAETKYKIRHGSFGDLAALRDAHLLDALAFDSDKPTDTASNTNLVPKSTHFEVSASSDGEHYKVSICEVLEESTICDHGDEISTGFSHARRPHEVPPPEDGPEGPLLSLPT